MDLDIKAVDVVRLANHVLAESMLPGRVRHVKECDSVLFSSLYVVLTGQRVPARGASASEQVKCQAVVDALNNQLPDDVTLDHISGADIAKGDLVSIRNLLDIFSILLHSSVDEEELNDDSNLLSSEGAKVVDEVLQEELGHTHSSDSTAELLQRVPPAHLPPTASKLLQRLRESPVGTLSISTCSSSTSPSSQPSTPPAHRIQVAPLHQSTPHEGPRSRLVPPLVPTINSELGDTPTPTLSISTLSPRSTQDSALSTPSHTTNSRAVPHSKQQVNSRPVHAGPVSSSVSPGSVTDTGTSSSDIAAAAEQNPTLENDTRGGQPSEEATSDEEEEEEDQTLSERTATTDGFRKDLLERLVQNYTRKKSKMQKSGGRVKFASKPKSKHSPSGVAGPHQQQRGVVRHRPVNLLPLLDEMFPVVDKSSAMERRLWQMQMKQMAALTFSLPPPSVACQAKTQEVKQRQAALMDIVRKDLVHTRRMQALDQQKMRERVVRATEETNKLANARARRYFTDYELSLKAKLQKKRTREEQVVKNAFQKCLALQQEKVREMRVYAKQKQQTLVQEHAERLQSMEKFYQDQLEMVSEKVAQEKKETAIREKAQRETSQRLEREIRRKMENDVERLHDELRSWEEDCAHFRQLDAEMLVTRLQRGLVKAV